MKVVSLFDGISCGRVALERAGLPVSRYVAYEIDVDAVNCSKWNWPDIEHFGDVELAEFADFKGYDLVIGGFPCTDLSIGKNNREGLKGKHSRLFWELVRAIKEINPRYFLVENNYRMPKKDEAIITEALGVAPIHINSALVSAQNRDRLYWTNIPNVEQPIDRGIYLSEILEAKVPLKYYHADGAINYLLRADMNTRLIQDATRDKSRCIVANFSKGVPYNVLAVPCNTPNKVGELKKQQGYGLYAPNGKGLCLTTRGGGLAGPSSTLLIQPYGIAFRTRNTPDGRYKKPKIRTDGKSNALTTVTTDSMVIEPPLKSYCITASYGRAHPTGIPKCRKTQIVEYPKTGIPTFQVERGLLYYRDYKIPVKIPDGEYAIRKLTPLECERLQTLPDGYTEMLSDTQRYKALGNGWNADTIAHIFNYINVDMLI